MDPQEIWEENTSFPHPRWQQKAKDSKKKVDMNIGESVNTGIFFLCFPISCWKRCYMGWFGLSEKVFLEKREKNCNWHNLNWGFFVCFLFNFILFFSSSAIFFKNQLSGRVNYEYLACWYIYPQSSHQTCTNINRCPVCRSKANIHIECSPEAALNHSLQQGKNLLFSCKLSVMRTPQKPP